MDEINKIIHVVRYMIMGVFIMFRTHNISQIQPNNKKSMNYESNRIIETVY